MSGDGQLPAGARGRGAARHGVLPARGRDHTDASPSGPSQPWHAWKEQHRFFHPPPGQVPPPGLLHHPKKHGEGEEAAPGRGLGELCLCCWVLEVGQASVRGLGGVTVAEGDLHGTLGEEGMRE